MSTIETARRNVIATNLRVWDLGNFACNHHAVIAIDTTPEFKRFKARQWQVNINLLPRTEVDLNASGGLTFQ
jgi:hypothetical protein